MRSAEGCEKPTWARGLFLASLSALFLLSLVSSILFLWSGTVLWSVGYADYMRDMNPIQHATAAFNLKDFLDCHQYSQYYMGPGDSPPHVVSETASVVLSQCLTRKSPAILLLGLTAAAQLIAAFLGLVGLWKPKRWRLYLFASLAPISGLLTALSGLYVSERTAGVSAFFQKCDGLDEAGLERLKNSLIEIACWSGPLAQPVPGQDNRTVGDWLNNLNTLWISLALQGFSLAALLALHGWRYQNQGRQELRNNKIGTINEFEEEKNGAEQALLM